MAAVVAPPSPLKLVREFFGLKLPEMKALYMPLPQTDKDDLIKGLTPDPVTGVPSYTY
jgi:hypothetical protein